MASLSENSSQIGGGRTAVAVLGGGIAGMQAALDLADAGFHVLLIERSPAIGGRMVQLDKTFPTNDCSMCTISPRLVQVERHPNITLWTNTEVVDLEGQPGQFRLRVLRRPRFVDTGRCNSCGDCVAVCPVNMPNPFEAGLGLQKAIGKPYPQAVPSAVSIKKNGVPPCRQACPAGVNVQGYVALVAAGKWAEAYRLIRQRNPFVSVCGRICHHPCESACYRGEVDEPLAIRAIKRAVAEWVYLKRQHGEDPAPPSRGVIDPTKPKVAIIGGGPAGLTAAQDLALQGYPVTLFEESQHLGGMLRQAVPEFRLPEEALEQDLQDILAAGFRVCLGWRLGRDGTVADLREQGFQAIFLATGCPKPVSLDLPVAEIAVPEDFGPIPKPPQVFWGVQFLRMVRGGFAPPIGGRVVVIGGGNVAIDVARTARRLGATEVEIVCLEPREQMPAYSWEIADAEAEGVKISCGWGPVKYLVNSGQLRGILFRRCTRVYDHIGFFAPVFADDLYEAKADWAVIAIGQRADETCFQEAELYKNGRIHADPETLQTNIPYVFAGGDVLTGPRSVVEAVAQGHQAALSIDRFLRGLELRKPEEFAANFPVHRPDRPVSFQPRILLEHRPLRGTGEFDEVDRPPSPELAQGEASRCLACGGCSECLLCVQACTATAIKHEMLPQEVVAEVAAVILAPGVEPITEEVRGELGLGRLANVITAMQMERLLSASGPTGGHVRRPSNQKTPRRVAWILCVGSRDASCGVPYCSSVCCMFAVKQALVATEHHPEMQAVIFYNDLRAFGKGFEAFVQRAKNTGRITLHRGLVAAVKEDPQSGNLILHVLGPDGRPAREEFELVVLATGMRPSPAGLQLIQKLGLEVNSVGLPVVRRPYPTTTSRPGVFVAGAFVAPMDIPEAVTWGSAAAGAVMSVVGGRRAPPQEPAAEPPKPPGEEFPPRIGVFICRCGANIARVIHVDELVTYASHLPHVVYAEENLYTCSMDTQARMKQLVREHGLNRVVVASCTPRTHEILFRQTLREVGLNPYLFEMANIRDQCSWVHYGDPKAATAKAKALVRMAVARAARLRPVTQRKIRVEPAALVLGGGVAGLTASLSLASQKFRVFLVEKAEHLGGLARCLRFLPDGAPAQSLVADLIARVRDCPLIEVWTDASVEHVTGHVGQFHVVVSHRGQRKPLTVGAIIVATGGAASIPERFPYPHPRVLTQHQLEQRLAEGARLGQLKRVVMIQCVGSRTSERPYCSRVCCIQAVKNAILLKKLDPSLEVFVVHQDIRTYGQYELLYAEARQRGVVFLRKEEGSAVDLQGDGPFQVSFREVNLNQDLTVDADLVVLSTGVTPGPDNVATAQLLKVPLGEDGFFLEAHPKLRPVDFASEGIFVAGLAHGPKLIQETIAQALGAAARAGVLLSQGSLIRSQPVAQVEGLRCAGCLTCVRVCPFGVPRIGPDGVAEVDPLSCQGCGVCAASCPRNAVNLEHFGDEQMGAKLEVLATDDLCPALTVELSR